MHKYLLLLPLCLLAACSAVTADNYAKLHAGMSMAEVQDILGKPNSCSDVILVKKCTWGDEARYITVAFAGDAVLTTTADGLK